jgi:catechol-2,3-dioxygenase
MAPVLERIDHVHVFVADRAAAEAWYERVLGLARLPELAHWAAGGGPLTVGNASGTIHIALFESAGQPCRSTLAFGVAAGAFRDWQDHLSAQLDRGVEVVDHGEALSLYFQDPDGNPFEITCPA